MVTGPPPVKKAPACGNNCSKVLWMLRTVPGSDTNSGNYWQ